ncbi:MAG: LCP family protein, partial [Thermomicrobiales bacterium]
EPSDPQSTSQSAMQPLVTTPAVNQSVDTTPPEPAGNGLISMPTRSADPTGRASLPPEVTTIDTASPSQPPVSVPPTQESADTQPSPTESPLVPDLDTGGTTILLMGVDARDGESIDVGVRPDALAVLHLDDDGSCRMLAIPRDSRATLPGYGSSKINHALAVGGIPYELQVVETYLGIDIDHYGLVDFAGVTQIVDSVGGIEVNNPAAFTIGDQVFAAGPIHVDGERALLYSRYRGGADGDFGRINKQQQVLRAVLDRVASINLVSIVPSSFSLLADHIRTDFGPAGIVDLGTSYLDTCTATSLETRTIPGDVALLYDELMQMQLSFVVSIGDDIQNSVAWLLGA